MAVYDLNTDYADLREGFLADAAGTLDGCLARIEHCVDQLTEEEVWFRPHPEMNAIGNLLLHLAGNISQWILSGVGGQPDTRRRQEEFDCRDRISKVVMLHRLRAVIEAAKGVILRQTEADLLTRRPIQHYVTTGLTAVFHAAGHLEGHAQEIIYITRMLRGKDYKFLWTPPEKK